MEVDCKDPVKSDRPDLLVTGPGECLIRCTWGGEGGWVMEADCKDPVKSDRPDLSVTGPGEL